MPSKKAPGCTNVVNIDYFVDSRKIKPAEAIRKFNAAARKARRTDRAISATAWPNGTHTGRGWLVPYQMRVCVR